MRIVSHNQWKCDQNLDTWRALGADCSAAVRTAGFAKLYEELQPDLIGCQEVSFEMADCLQQQLFARGLHYTLLWGRDTPILYRTDKFEVLDADFFIYSEEFPGHEGSFNNQQTKSWCAAVLREKATGKLLAFMTTHLWWKSSNPANVTWYQADSDEARAYQINLAMDKLEELQKKYNCPAILVGDLNSKVSHPALQAAFARGFAHTHHLAKEAENSCGMHECGGAGYGPLVTGVFEDSIDHILLKGDVTAIHRFARYTPEYYAPLSDHAPVYIDMDL